MAEESKEHARISRRDLLKTAGAAGAAALLPGAAAAETTPATSSVAATTAMPAAPLMSLTAAETEILGAMVDRLIPADEMGPGALEAGALRFIDRLLSEEPESVEGYRAGIAALDSYSRSSHGAPFAELSDEDKDALLIDVQGGDAEGGDVAFEGSSGSFFNMVKSDVWQGTFGDPAYGGNVNFIGWDILGYPGVRMRVSPEDQRLMEAGQLTPVRRSAYEYGQFQLPGEER